MSSAPSSARQQVIETVQRLGLTSLQMNQAASARIGLSQLDLQVVQLLRQRDQPTTASDIARMTGISTAAATGLVDRLETVGYVRRSPDPNDRRRTHIELIGPRVGSDLGPVFAPLLQRWAGALAGYSNSELITVVAVLDAMIDSIGQEVSALRQS